MSNNIYIASAANVLAPAYAILKKLGYKVSIVSGTNEDSEQLLQAEKPGCRVRAEDTLMLLGLVKIAEERGVNWAPNDDEVNDLLTFLDVG